MMDRFIVDESNLISGSRELIHVPRSNDSLCLIPLYVTRHGALRPNTSRRVSDIYQEASGLLAHRCTIPQCDGNFVYVQFFDGEAETLTYHGVLHYDTGDLIFGIVEKLAAHVGLPEDENLKFFIEKGPENVVVSTEAGDLSSGDVVIVQRQSDVWKYINVFRSLPYAPAAVTFTPAPSNSPLTALAKRLWETRAGSDVVVKYGPDAGTESACHRLILMGAPYFQRLFNNADFAPVIAATIDSRFPGIVVELALEYLYLGDAKRLAAATEGPMDALLLMELLDFLNVEEPMGYLGAMFPIKDATINLVVDALELGMRCRAAQSIWEKALDWICTNPTSLKEPALRAFVMGSPEGYDAVMSRVAGRLTGKHVA